MIIPWLLDSHLFDSEYLSRDDEALEEMLDLFESFTLWPLSEKIRILITRQLEVLIQTAGSGPVVARAQSLKGMLSLYIRNHAVMVSDSNLSEEDADGFNLKLLQDIPSIEALVTYADRSDTIRQSCPESRRQHVCNVEKRRGTPLLARYLQLANGAIVDPDPATFEQVLSPFCFWASKLTVIDRYMGRSFTDFQDAQDENHKIQWGRCREAIRSLYEMWSKGATYVDKISFNLITIYEPSDRSSRRQSRHLKAPEAKAIVEEMVLDLGLPGKNVSVCMKEIENPKIIHDRYLVFGDNALAVGMSSGLANLRADGHGTLDLYRREAAEKNDKISKILAKASLAEVYGHKVKATPPKTSPPRPVQKFGNTGLSDLDRMFQ